MSSRKTSKLPPLKKKEKPVEIPADPPAAAEETTILPVAPTEEAIGQPAKLTSEEPVAQGGLGPSVLMEPRIPAPPKPKNPVYHEGRLTPGLLIVMIDAGKRTVFRVVYVNNSRAWCVPPGSPQTEGVSIGANSYVEVYKPLTAEEQAAEWDRQMRVKYPHRFKEESTAMGTAAMIPVASKSNRDKNKEMKAAKAAKTAGLPLRGAAAKSAAAKKAKPNVPKTVRACACGCGTETTGYFAPGHDARVHGWIKKLADGRIDVKGKDAKSGEQIIPAAVLKRFEVVATKNGAKVGKPHFWAD